jgi:hypothetical protein
MLNNTILVDIGPQKPGNVIEKRVSRNIVNENISLCSLDGEKIITQLEEC